MHLLRISTFGMLFLGTMGLSATPTTHPTTVPAEEEPFAALEGIPSTRPAIPITDLINFQCADGYLVVQTKQPPSPQAQLQQVQGMIAPVQFAIRKRDPVQTELYTPDTITVICPHRDGPQIMRTSIYTVLDHLNLSRDIVFGPVEQSIQFTQSTLPGSAGAAARLQVQTMAGENQASQVFVAENFATFIRKYPDQTTTYLRPMLETFGNQPQLFAVDDLLACSVLPEAFQVDATVKAQIMQLVMQLKADDFQQRQKAQSALQVMGTKAAPVLASLDRTNIDPEQATRIDLILSQSKPPFIVDSHQLQNNKSFLLDCLLSQNKNVRTAALTRLSALTGRKIELQGNDTSAVYELRRVLLSPPSTNPTTNPF